ncbi:hypothetical protein GmHk_10G028892 [Glycine max]|nr:hypothetical protein GmHk_10G028892 [Glycine max]
MAAQLIHDRVVMECLEGVWETFEGNESTSGGTRTHTSADCGVDTTYTTPYRLVESVQVIEVSSSEEDPEEDLEELPPEPAVDALDFPEDDEDPLPDVDSPEDIMSASGADSTEESGPRGTASSEDSSS